MRQYGYKPRAKSVSLLTTRNGKLSSKSWRKANVSSRSNDPRRLRRNGQRHLISSESKKKARNSGRARTNPHPHPHPHYPILTPLLQHRALRLASFLLDLCSVQAARANFWAFSPHRPSRHYRCTQISPRQIQNPHICASGCDIFARRRLRAVRR